MTLTEPRTTAPWVVPADLHDGAGVILCSPERRRLLTQLAAYVDDGTCFDGANESAAETVVRLQSTGAERVVLVRTPRDGRAAEILADQCRDAGLVVEDLVTSLEGLVPGVARPATDESPSGYLLLEAGALADWSSASSGRPTLRQLVPTPLASLPAHPDRRSPLPPGIPLEAIRVALLRLVAENFPAAISRLHAVLAWHELGINGIEDQYAGLGLLERNAELLANLVPDPRGTA